MINELYRCQNCRFHEASDDTCRRHAPKPPDSQAYASWPAVRPDDWCGEFKFKLGEAVPVKSK